MLPLTGRSMARIIFLAGLPFPCRKPPQDRETERGRHEQFQGSEHGLWTLHGIDRKGSYGWRSDGDRYLLSWCPDHVAGNGIAGSAVMFLRQIHLAGSSSML